jgi:hypothetical protein
MLEPINRDQETKLRQVLSVVGLPEDSVRFVQAENWSNVSASAQDRRPAVVELTTGLGVPREQTLLRILECGVGPLDLFVFGAAASASSEKRESHRLLSRASVGKHAPTVSPVQFSNDALWGPLQGLSAEWLLSPESVPRMSLEVFRLWHPLIRIAGSPWFLWKTATGTTVFLWNSGDLPDITESIAPEEEHQSHRLLQFLPLLAFFRHAFGKRIWHVPTPFANLIVDDPPVRDRYGSFSPTGHLASLADIPQATTVAFIPWNWNRSTETAAELFRAHCSQLSLCIHGCDHTKGEFAALNHDALAGKCQLALQRAELFRQRTELSCEPVMVFPQGLFSKAAVTALRDANFLAAVNSTLFPVDLGESNVCLADMVEPAFMRIEDFPIFLRRYPKDPTLCAVDLFLGRHLLLVEHQDYFRDGYKQCRRFLEAINSFRSRPTWAPLDQIVRRACLQREIEPGTFDVRFYANTFVLENSSEQRLSYRLRRRCTRIESVSGVLLNGSPLTHSFEDGHIVFAVELDAKASVTVRLVNNAHRANHIFNGSLPYHIKVWTRRNLCDLRDNHVWISRTARWLRSALQRT